MFGAGEARDGLPVASRKPVLIMIGDEDDFVQRVFVSLFQSGGGRGRGRPRPGLPARSRARRAGTHGEPAAGGLERVAACGLRPAAGDRAEHRPLHPLRRLRAPLPLAGVPARGAALRPDPRAPPQAHGQAAPSARREKSGSATPQLGWSAVGETGEVYLPHVIRDWYARAWFDWHLKGDEDARKRLLKPDPFGALTSERRELQ